VLSTLMEWNRKHGRSDRVGLWFPINIREHPSEGFGNGTSRIRIYADFTPHDALPERCRKVHAQIVRARESGEWHVPDLRLPRFLLRLYLNRPWVDVGSTVFTHLDRLESESFPGVTSIEVIGQMHHRYPVAWNAVTLRGVTRLTLTYDPARIHAEDAEELLSAFRELSPCSVS